jgi:AcrR family transcriptional regulator
MLSQSQERGTGNANASRTAILDSAEKAFAELGYGGASIRAIARDANVNQAMVHYYYQNKDQLFTAVIERRAGEINARRDDALERLFEDRMPSLEKLIEALLRPTIEIGHDDERGGAAYARLIASFNNAADERSRRVTMDNYDPIARRSIDAIRRVVPELNKPAAVRGYLFSISAALSVMAKTGRATRLSDGLLDDFDTEETVASAVAFACAGIRALASNEKNVTE